jgi:hypothetical protein
VRVTSLPENVTKELVNFLFEYKDGNLFWKNLPNDKRHFKVNLSEKAGGLSGTYEKIRINEFQIETHRLIWLYHFGDIEKGLEIDHIDRNPLNNCIENLRVVTKSQNQMNSKARGLSKYKGVSWDKTKWRARIWVNKKEILLGKFSTEIEAAVAYNNAAILNFKEYAKLNEIANV